MTFKHNFILSPHEIEQLHLAYGDCEKEIRILNQVFQVSPVAASDFRSVLENLPKGNIKELKNSNTEPYYRKFERKK